ncbi:hypothetical protein MHK_010776, partial [Candidatus Magnetomorum sp. HK-1]
MNIFKQEGAAVLEFWAVVNVAIILGFYSYSSYEIKKISPEETVKIKPIIKYVEKNPVSHALENTSIPVYKTISVRENNQFQTPKKFKSSQAVIRKVNKNAHLKPFIAKKDNLLGYKGACMKYPFSSKVFHVDVKYPVAAVSAIKLADIID